MNRSDAAVSMKIPEVANETGNNSVVLSIRSNEVASSEVQTISGPQYEVHALRCEQNTVNVMGSGDTVAELFTSISQCR